MYLQAINKTVQKMDKTYESVGKGYITMTGLVAKAKDEKAYEEEGYKNIYDLCADRYRMSRGTVGNLMRIFSEYYDPETYKVLPQYAEKSYSQLLEELPTRKSSEAKSAESAEAESAERAEAIKEIVNSIRVAITDDLGTAIAVKWVGTTAELSFGVDGIEHVVTVQ